MTSYGITGAQRIGDDWAYRTVIDRIHSLPADATLITGGRTGVEILAAECGIFFKHAVHVVAPFGHQHIDAEWAVWSTTIEEMPSTKTTLHDRDKRILELADIVWFFPIQPEHHSYSEHSRTWHMVRAARRAHKSHVVIPLWPLAGHDVAEMLVNWSQL